jgi:hypothetical protein
MIGAPSPPDDLVDFIERGQRAQAAVTFELAMIELRALGITIASLPGEYRVNFPQRRGVDSVHRRNTRRRACSRPRYGGRAGRAAAQWRRLATATAPPAENSESLQSSPSHAAHAATSRARQTCQALTLTRYAMNPACPSPFIETATGLRSIGACKTIQVAKEKRRLRVILIAFFKKEKRQQNSCGARDRRDFTNAT